MRGTPGSEASFTGRLALDELPFERGRRSRDNESGAGAFEKLPAGDISLAFAHDTFPERYCGKEGH